MSEFMSMDTELVVPDVEQEPVGTWVGDPRGGLVDVPPPRNLFKEHTKVCSGRPEIYPMQNQPHLGGDGVLYDYAAQRYFDSYVMPIWHQCERCGKCVLAHRDGQPPKKIPERKLSVWGWLGKQVREYSFGVLDMLGE